MMLFGVVFVLMSIQIGRLAAGLAPAGTPHAVRNLLSPEVTANMTNPAP